MQYETLRTTFWRDLARLKNRQLSELGFFLAGPDLARVCPQTGGYRRKIMIFTKNHFFFCFSRLGFATTFIGYLAGFGRLKRFQRMFLKNKKSFAAADEAFFLSRDQGGLASGKYSKTMKPIGIAPNLGPNESP